MHLLLTDRLACPRCGPPHGLILLAERVDDRRVHDGALGCSNCRERYPVAGGLADLRPPPRGRLPSPDPDPQPPSREEAVRLAAFLGVTSGPGYLLLDGTTARFAPALVEAIPEIEIVAVGSASGVRPPGPRISRIVTGSRLPFFSGTFRGVAVAGRTERDLDEELRLLAPRGRFVVLDPPPGTADALRERGFGIALEAPAGVVAARG